MQSTQESSLKAGIFVIIAGFLLISGILTLGKREQLWAKHEMLWARFENAAGIIPGADVRIAGVTAGSVRNVMVTHSSGGDTTVLLMLDISDQYFSFITDDSVASIQTMGPLGDKYIEVSLGTNGSRELRPKEQIKTAEPLDFYEIAEEMRAALNKVNHISQRLASTLEAFEESGIIEDTSAAAKGMRSIVERVEKGPSLMHSVFYDPELPEILENMHVSSGILRTTFEDMKAGENNLGELMCGEKVAGSIDNLASASAGMKRIVTEVETGNGITHALIYDEAPKKALADFVAAAESARKVLGEIESGQGMVHAAIYDKKSGAAIKNLTEATERMNAILNDVQQGKGTLGLLLSDPTTWESLTRILGDAEESRVLKMLIRNAAKPEATEPEAPAPTETPEGK